MFKRDVACDEAACQRMLPSSAKRNGFRKTMRALAAGTALIAGAPGLPAAHAGGTAAAAAAATADKLAAQKLAAERAAAARLTYKVLYTFTGGNDGAWPAGNLVADTQGNLYGMTSAGGPNGAGVVYKLAPDGTQTVLFHFNGANGNLPMAGLTPDAAGNLYGVTETGGKYGWGNVFKLTPEGVLTSLYDFGGTNGDGLNPVCQLVWGANGELVGTTVNGGTGAVGTVFSVSLDGKGTILHSFASSGAEGKYPPAGAAVDAAGNVYGVTHTAGGGNSGTVWKVDTAGAFSVLYTLDNQSGYFSHAALTVGPDQSLYGSTQGGGASGYGTIFRVNPDRTLNVLYSFTGGADGGAPNAPLMLDRKGDLYGTTQGAGGAFSGTIFSLATDGTFKTMYSFNSTGSTGAYPAAGVIRDPAAGLLWLYGTTYAGGANGSGVIFRVLK